MIPAAHQTMLAPKGGPSTLDYVQDSAFLFLDGIENAGRGTHDASSAVWKDLIGTRDFTVNLTNAEWEKDALYAKNRNAATMDAVPFSSDYTVQFVVKQLYSGTGNSAYIILGLDDTRYYGLLHRPTVAALMCDRTYFTNSATAGYRCLSFSGITNTTASMWADGSVVSANGYNSLDYSSARGNVARIGGSGDSDRPIKIQAIRIYSRALTDAEIAHNYAIDKARFNLP
ncbi:MAG: hypothetical protein IIZ06_08080 [Kiritimatiellae bacterium]|nr:hypothetical protein [Kiritimatiellia bacterium]